MKSRCASSGGASAPRGRDSSAFVSRRLWRPSVALLVLLVLATLCAAPSGAAAATPEGPGNGTPWVVSLGDSYVSGEAGRWAGNVEQAGDAHRIDAGHSDAYDDRNYGTPSEEESTPKCHRSHSAEIHIGEGVESLNLACSGARSGSRRESTVVSVFPKLEYGWNWKPGLDFCGPGKHEAACPEGISVGPSGERKPLEPGEEGQALMLEHFAEAHNVKMVLVGIGGNDFEFSTLVKECGKVWGVGYVTLLGRLLSCSTDPSTFTRLEAPNVRIVTEKIEQAIKNVAQAMRAAGYSQSQYTLAVQTYPDPIAPATNNRWGAWDIRRFGSGGCPLTEVDEEWARNTIIPTVNGALLQAVEHLGLSNAITLNWTNAFEWHLLCENGVGDVADAWNLPSEEAGANGSEWVNRVWVESDELKTGELEPPLEENESLHPNYWGQLALRNCLRQAYHGVHGTPTGGTCIRPERSGPLYTPFEPNAQAEPSMVFQPDLKPDGTFVGDHSDGNIYRIAGGAPIYVQDCAPFSGGCAPIASVLDLAGYAQYPAEAPYTRYPNETTTLCGQKVGGGGGEFVVAGGAPVWVTDTAHIPNDYPPCVPVDQYAIDHAGGGGALDHLRYRPQDGTVLVGTGVGSIAFYVMAGGTPFPVEDCGFIAAPCENAVAVDKSAIEGAGGPGYLSHLASVPADGTVVLGLPSQQGWEFQQGVRHHAGSLANAVRVEDKSLAQFPIYSYTSTKLSCPNPLPVGRASTCTATVENLPGGGSTVPAGTVTFKSGTGGTFGPSASCALGLYDGSCTVTFTPSVDGPQALEANYAGDRAHAESGAMISITAYKLLSAGVSSCNGYSGGSGGGVTVPKGAVCTLVPGTQVGSDVNVMPGGTLVDEGTTVAGNVIAKGAQVRLGGAAPNVVGKSVQISGGTPGPDYVCNTKIGANLEVNGVGAGAGPVTVGAAPSCAAGDQVGKLLVVSGNAATVTVAGTAVGLNASFYNNTGNVSFSDGSTGGDLVLRHNTGAIGVSKDAIGRDLVVEYNTGAATVSNSTAARNAYCINNKPAASGAGNTIKGKNNKCPT